MNVNLFFLMNELMRNSLFSSLSSPSNSSVRIGAITVDVPITGRPNFVPSGINPHNPASAMVDTRSDTRSNDARHLEEMLTTAMADLSAKIADADHRREDVCHDRILLRIAKAGKPLLIKGFKEIRKKWK